MVSRVTPMGDGMLHVREIGYRPAVTVFETIADEPVLAWLDSAAESDPRGRWSMLCVRPFRTIEAWDGQVRIDGRPVDGDAFSVLDRELRRYRITPGASPVPFTGGAVGSFGYGLGGLLETLPARHPNDLGLPEMSVGLFDVVMGFDHQARRCWLISSGFPEQGARRASRAVTRADEVEALLGREARDIPACGQVAWRAELDRATYERRVGWVLGKIRAGDIFQANFTMRLQGARPAGLSAAGIHLRLRAESPAPFAAFLRRGRRALASASPERFLRLDADGQIETRPIKGTRPRDADPDVDSALRGTLAASIKDRAENLMIVDLMRNDLGRVARPGSVAVPTLHEVETFASAHHLVSEVTAQLRSGLGPVDLLRATFPGGSVTGAPKIQAMQIIDAIEASARGPYCGSIGWIGFDGAMDSSIVIRTVVVAGDRLVAQAGGGIVADSDPASEYEEMRVKLGPVLRALGDEVLW